MSRTKNTIRNMKYAMLFNIVTFFLNFLLRKVLVDSVGTSGVGLNSLFNEVLAVLSISELGIATAISYNLYKPLAEGNQTKVIALMSFFRTAYRMIAAFILIAGLCLLPFITSIVNGVEFEDSYIRLIFILFVFKTASSYLFSYKRTLITADQKMYIISIIDTIYKVAYSTISIIVLLFTKSYVAFLVAQIVCSLINNIAISVKADKMYPYLNKAERLRKEEKQRVFADVRDIFIAKVSATVTTATDNILISALVGTIEVGLYSNYALVINSVKGILSQFVEAAHGSVGNLMASDEKEKCCDVLHKMTFLEFVCATITGAGMFCLFTDFISMWIGAEYLLDDIIVFVCVLNHYFILTKSPLWQFMNCSGLFHADKYISILGTVINLLVSFVIGKKFGMIGIFLGTTCTYVIQITLKIYLLYKKRFEIEPSVGYLFWLKQFGVFLLVVFSTRYITGLIHISPIMLQFLVRGVVCLAISLGILIAFYKRSEYYEYCVNAVKFKVKTR